MVAYQPTAARREQLRQQHGFTCGCARCEHEPELVRCFVCPACGEGPASPVTSGVACRTLACTECGATSVLDEEAWAPLAAAEASDDMNPKPKPKPKPSPNPNPNARQASDDMSECMRYLHPYHHRMVRV